jgi:hypothetical protein
MTNEPQKTPAVDPKQTQPNPQQTQSNPKPADQKSGEQQK